MILLSSDWLLWRWSLKANPAGMHCNISTLWQYYVTSEYPPCWCCTRLTAYQLFRSEGSTWHLLVLTAITEQTFDANNICLVNAACCLIVLKYYRHYCRFNAWRLLSCSVDLNNRDSPFWGTSVLLYLRCIRAGHGIASVWLLKCGSWPQCASHCDSGHSVKAISCNFMSR